jgi:hypothetical protein
MIASSLRVFTLAMLTAAAFGTLAVSTANATIKIGGVQVSVIIGNGEASQQHTLTIPGNPSPFNAVCDSASIEGTVQGQVLEDVTLTPTYSSCKLAGTAATVQMNGCKYTLTGEGQPAQTALGDIVGCTSGKQIQVKTALCTVDIPAQNSLSHMVGSNIGGNEITTSLTMGGVTAVQTGAACPGGNNAHTSAASLAGNTTAKAFQDSGSTQVTKHSHQYSEVNAGSQVSLTIE